MLKIFIKMFYFIIVHLFSKWLWYANQIHLNVHVGPQHKTSVKNQQITGYSGFQIECLYIPILSTKYEGNPYKDATYMLLTLKYTNI